MHKRFAPLQRLHGCAERVRRDSAVMSIRFPLMPSAVIVAATLMPAGMQPALAAAASPVSVPCSTTALASAMTGAVGGETIRLAAGCDYVLPTARAAPASPSRAGAPPSSAAP